MILKLMAHEGHKRTHIFRTDVIQILAREMMVLLFWLTSNTKTLGFAKYINGVTWCLKQTICTVSNDDAL